jgi:hypothetical protein
MKSQINDDFEIMNRRCWQKNVIAKKLQLIGVKHFT